MLRKLFFGACIGGLVIGQFYSAPKEQQALEEKLLQNLQSQNQQTRKLAEGELLKLAKHKSNSKSKQAEALIKQILASNPNSAKAHMRLAEIQLRRWNVNKNPTDKAAGINHLRQARELYRQENADLIAQKLEKVESQVNQGIPAYAWDFPQF